MLHNFTNFVESMFKFICHYVNGLKFFHNTPSMVESRETLINDRYKFSGWVPSSRWHISLVIAVLIFTFPYTKHIPVRSINSSRRLLRI